MIAIVDYGMGNLRSVAAAVRKVGGEPFITANPVELERARRIILPGVGAFGNAMDNLHARGLVELLTHLALDHGCPVLGICLGFQLMCSSSTEFGPHQGLGWFKARVERFELSKCGLRVPHVGWNGLLDRADHPMFAQIPIDALFYHVHSYRVVEPDEPGTVTARCEYGERFCTALARSNLWATQFHPEKSQLHGLRLLRNFLEAE